MNLNINHNEIITTSRKKFNTPSFGNKPTYTIKKDDDTKDTALKIAGSVTVLTGLGVAILKKDQVISMFNKSKHFLKNSLKSSEKAPIGFDTRTHGGPKFNPKNGKYSIKQAWNQYIKEIDRRIANHEQKEKLYQQLLAPDSRRANDMEQLAKKRCLARGGKWE